MNHTDPTGDALRANSWDAYIGQDKLKARLSLHINAANTTERTLDHVLLEGPPGYGKTTIATIIADELGADFEMMKMPVKSKVLAGFLRDWDGGILFLDEIHGCTAAQQRDLLPLLEEGYLQLDNGRKQFATDCCVIAATTEPHKVTAPLRDRFPIRPRFEEYTDAQMTAIVAGMAAKVGLELDESTLSGLSRACIGTPRIARSLVLTARDMADTGQAIVVDQVLAFADVDRDGLSGDHVAYLALMHELGSVEVGMKTLTTILRKPEATVRELERVLMKKGLLRFEKTGRELTATGVKRINGKGTT